MGERARQSSSTAPTGEHGEDSPAAKELDEIAPGIVLVSLPGHTRGHACIAVDAGHRWVLHCGDAFYHYGSLDGTHVPRTLWAMETAVAFDRKKMWDNHARLSELYRRAESDLFMASAHDMELFERAKATAEPAALGHQHHFPDVLPRGQNPVCLTGVGERHGLVNDGHGDAVGQRRASAGRSTVPACRGRPTA